MIQVTNLTVAYSNQELAIERINLTFEGPMIAGIIGPNGAGKSTLLKAILAILPHEGEVTIDGQTAKKGRKKVAYVEQKSQIDYTFPIKVKECVSLGTYNEVGLCRKLQSKQWQQVDEALAKVGLSEFANRQISELSGGQFQRVLIARCLVQQADYIFLDEPFVGIDLISEQIIMGLLNDLKKEGRTILIVHHDLSKVKLYFDHVLLLNKQVIAYGPTADTFTAEQLRQTYGENLFVGGVDA
ncbi:metal ABC transporter ATP-binding protein [Enterococcus camelliae]|uniref:Metal ABC transporter ATP-binding protein n=1 Tax=Enterococcus camelliae TaxID=453959 RepID=A0ABW5TJA7_9ENTE